MNSQTVRKQKPQQRNSKRVREKSRNVVEDYFCHEFLRNLSEVYCSQEYQKQPFVDFLQNRCSYKFRNILWKAPVLESLFNKKRLYK